MAKRTQSIKARIGSIMHLEDVRKWHGDEPVWAGIKITDLDYNMRLTHAMNWANAAFDKTMFKTIVLEYFKDNEEMAFLKDVPEAYFICGLGMQCWLRQAKAPMKPESDVFFESCINDIRKRFDAFNLEALKDKNMKQDADLEEEKLSPAQTDVMEYVNLYSQLDALISNDNAVGEEVYNIIRQAGPSIATLRMLLTHYQENVDEAREFNKINSKQELKVKKYMSTFLNNSATIVSQVEKLLDNTKAEKKLQKFRRPRKKKIKPANMQIKNLQFKERDEDLKLVSVPPSTLVNAMTLVVFNTKTRKVGMYYAKTTDGLTVKGTTIQNFDTDKSVQKTLRKPEEMIEHLVGTSVKRYEKVFEGIRAVDTKLTGRINTDTLLLKVFKVK